MQAAPEPAVIVHGMPVQAHGAGGGAPGAEPQPQPQQQPQAGGRRWLVDGVHRLALHGGEHEVSAEKTAKGLRLQAQNMRSGDAFQADIDIEAVCPDICPAPLKQPANFFQMVACSLQAEAGVAGAAEAIEGASLTCTSGEDGDGSVYEINAQIQMGSGMMAMTFMFPMKLPLHKKADADTRHELNIDTLRKRLQALERASAQQIAALQQRVDQLMVPQASGEVLVLLREGTASKLIRVQPNDPVLVEAAAKRAASGAEEFPWDAVAGASIPIELTKSVNISTRTTSFPDVGVLASLPFLNTVHLGLAEDAGVVSPPTDLSFVTGCPHLVGLTMYNDRTLADLNGLESLKFLASVTLKNCTALADMSALSDIGIETLTLEGLTALVKLPKLTLLTKLDMTGCTMLQDVTPLAGCTKLISVALKNCTAIADLSGLSDSGVESLTLLGLTALVKLPHLPLLTHISMTGCTALRDVSPLVGCTKLRFHAQYQCVSSRNLGGSGPFLKIK
eukprot:SAG22_NODE_701_length_7790_cov_3.878689_3_plen_506_part_00